MKGFRELQEAKTVGSDYKLIILSAHDSDDPNTTAVLIKANAKKMGIECHLCDFNGLYISTKNGKDYINTFAVDKEGLVITPTLKSDDIDYIDPIEIDPKNTLILLRGLGHPGVTSKGSYTNVSNELTYRGYTLINSVKCHEICSDKDNNQLYFERNNLVTPKTVRVTHQYLQEKSFDRLGMDFPIIMKTARGSQGVGVLLIDSMKSLLATGQLVNKLAPFEDVLIQEYVESKYDVRVIVCGGEIMGAMKRPVVEGDFRSNVAQGSKPEVFECTQKEQEECIRAAKVVDGQLVGVDFIPATDRDKGDPIFIEVNSSPGLNGIEEVVKDLVKDVLLKLRDRSIWS